MTGTFIDTLIICTLTGFTILVTDQWSVEGLAGAPLTQAAFATVFGNTGSIALTISLVLLLLQLFSDGLTMVNAVSNSSLAPSLSCLTVWSL